jgi:acyl-CoA reductase-like NAD-dependent aldehyde dehydrogenase
MPTVLTGVTPNMSAYRDEIFGPVACITKYTDKDDVIAMANDNTFGLTASVWTKDTARGLRAAHELQTGTAFVNDHMIMAGLPFGGVKESGIGKDSLEDYTEIKSIYANITEGGKIDRMLI